MLEGFNNNLVNSGHLASRAMQNQTVQKQCTPAVIFMYFPGLQTALPSLILYWLFSAQHNYKPYTCGTKANQVPSCKEEGETAYIFALFSLRNRINLQSFQNAREGSHIWNFPAISLLSCLHCSILNTVLCKEFENVACFN